MVIEQFALQHKWYSKLRLPVQGLQKLIYKESAECIKNILGDESRFNYLTEAGNAAIHTHHSILIMAGAELITCHCG